MADFGVSKVAGKIFVEILAEDDKDLKKTLKMFYEVKKFRDPEYPPYRKKLRGIMG